MTKMKTTMTRSTPKPKQRLRELVAIGDLHLTDSTGRGGLSAYVKDSDRVIIDLVIAQPLKYALDNGITDIVLLGDLCEGPRFSYEAQLEFLRLLREPFTFHLIPGNHDMIAEDPVHGHSLQLIQEFRLPNVKIYTKPTVVDKVRFCPWPCAEFDPKYLNVAHVDVQGSKSDNGRMNKSDKLNASEADAVIGHIHTSQKVRNSVYPGTLYQTNFGEGLQKFFAHCSYDDGWETALVRVKPPYRLHTVEVKTKKDLKGLKATPRDLYKLILLDGAKISPADYKDLRVEKVRTVNSDTELALAHIEDVATGSDVEISTTEFVEAWLANRVDSKTAAKAMTTRKRLLGGK